MICSKTNLTDGHCPFFLHFISSILRYEYFSRIFLFDRHRERMSDRAKHLDVRPHQLRTDLQQHATLIQFM